MILISPLLKSDNDKKLIKVIEIFFLFSTGLKSFHFTGLYQLQFYKISELRDFTLYVLDSSQTS